MPLTDPRILKRIETSSRRATMETRCYELKIQENKLSITQKDKLLSYFSQAKWLCNDALNSLDTYDFKTKQATVKWTKDDIEHTEFKQLALPSQIKQALLAKMKIDIVNLAKKKKKGYKVGKLKFKKQVDCIPLVQYKTTWKFGDKKKIHIAGIGYVNVNGKDQLTNDIQEYGPAKLLRKPDGLFIQITCFKDKIPAIIPPQEVIGLDFGIKDDITLSTGEKLNFKVPIPKSLKRCNRKLSKRAPSSNNRRKQLRKLKKQYQKLTNIKNDKTNKFVSRLKNEYKTIIIQDENIKGWHAGLFGKQVQQSCLGRIKSKLEKLSTTLVIDRFEPTTQLCPLCGKKNKLSLSERYYRCSCGFEEARDIKAARTIVVLGLVRHKSRVPTERRDFKPVEIEASTISEKYKLLFGDGKSLIVEAGSLLSLS